MSIYEYSLRIDHVSAADVDQELPPPPQFIVQARTDSHAANAPPKYAPPPPPALAQPAVMVAAAAAAASSVKPLWGRNERLVGYLHGYGSGDQHAIPPQATESNNNNKENIGARANAEADAAARKRKQMREAEERIQARMTAPYSELSRVHPIMLKAGNAQQSRERLIPIARNTHADYGGTRGLTAAWASSSPTLFNGNQQHYDGRRGIKYILSISEEQSCKNECVLYRKYPWPKNYFFCENLANDF